MISQKLKIFQHTATIYILQILFNRFSSSIGRAQRCAQVNEVLNPRLRHLPPIQRCQVHLHLMCFVDDSYMCLCTLERHANCFKFQHILSVCQHTTYCLNGAQCLSDGSMCPLATFCNCTDCFFGDRCQFYAKGIGLTRDDILQMQR
ncbi:unnamed protein product [Adineta ricciae]|uniref:EGF-like domain-containing protein n=1 Tax=Adineta ricciae TaxID=249248 RepID=A0A815GJ88_ADIRI|nr:unnamed protein product [Adineta ricciae]CAF1515700.1 unnamed protein product [Adineta ricciae]